MGYFQQESIEKLLSQVNTSIAILHEGALDQQKKLVLYWQAEAFLLATNPSKERIRKALWVFIFFTDIVQIAKKELKQDSLKTQLFSVSNCEKYYLFRYSFVCDNKDEVRNWWARVDRINPLDQWGLFMLKRTIFLRNSSREPPGSGLSLIHIAQKISNNKKYVNRILLDLQPINEQQDKVTVYACVHHQKFDYRNNSI